MREVYMTIGKIKIPRKFIQGALSFPEGHYIINCEWDNDFKAIIFTVNGPQLPKKEEGQPIPYVRTRYKNGEMKFEKRRS